MKIASPNYDDQLVSILVVAVAVVAVLCLARSHFCSWLDVLLTPTSNAIGMGRLRKAGFARFAPPLY